MIRMLFAAFFIFFATMIPSVAQTCASYPNTLVNGQVADANQVMANFNYVLNCVRDRLTANRTYYVRTDGSDSNNGLANTSGGAFLTIQKALSVVSSLDMSTFNVTVQVADGTYTGVNSVTAAFLGSGTVTIQGNTGTPANVIISTTSANCFSAAGGGRIIISGMELRTTTAGNGVFVNGGGSVITIGTSVRFGAIAEAQMRADASGKIATSANYSIVGGAGQHILVANGGLVEMGGITVTLTGTPAFSAFAFGTAMGLISMYAVTWSGSATGARYSASGNSVINTFGQATTYLPGSNTGSTTTGGQYL